MRAIYILTVLLFSHSCHQTSTYEYDASNFISVLRDYSQVYEIPELVVYTDSVVSIRNQYYELSTDKKIYTERDGKKTLLSKEELTRVFSQIDCCYKENVKKEVIPRNQNKKQKNTMHKKRF